jgi:hypothetical protein
MPYVAKRTLAGKVHVVDADQLKNYKFHRVDDAADPIYVLYESKAGDWYALRFNTTTGLGDYAAESNNAGVTSVTAAYTARAALNYALLSTLTLP